MFVHTVGLVHLKVTDIEPEDLDLYFASFADLPTLIDDIERLERLWQQRVLKLKKAAKALKLNWAME